MGFPLPEGTYQYVCVFTEAAKQSTQTSPPVKVREVQVSVARTHTPYGSTHIWVRQINRFNKFSSEVEKRFSVLLD